MKTFILAAAVSLALTGAVLAVPNSTEELPVAPAPRVVFVAPTISNVRDVLVFTNARPVRIRATIHVDGKTVDEMWRERMKKLFEFCDRNDDGVLSEKEAKYAFSDQGLAQGIQNGYIQPGQSSNANFSDIDKDGDGRVTFEEFLASYPRTISQLMSLAAPQPDYTNNAAVTEALFKLFDINGDGKLTKDELKQAEKYLATRDSDEDECLSVQELLPDVYSPRQGRVRVPGGLQPAGRTTDMSKTVRIYEPGLIPGAVTQVVIGKYDKNDDFELTKEEIGFDAETFKTLDKDGNGKLDGEEFDAWRTGQPDLEMTFSLSEKTSDCAAKISDEKKAQARGFKLKQSEPGRLILQVGRESIDLSAFTSSVQYGRVDLKQSYAYLFTEAAGKKDYIVEKDLTGPNAVQFQFIRVIFETADRDGNGKLTKPEFDAYFDLQGHFYGLGVGITPAIQTPSLFQLLDENRDGRLGVREVRTAWNRLIVLEDAGAEVVTKNIIQPSVTIRVSRALDRYYYPAQQGVNNANQVFVPTKGPVWFRKMDRNGDGDVSRSEYIGTKEEFDALDTDHDDLISLEEAQAWDKKMREKEEKPDEPKPDKPKPDESKPEKLEKSK